MSFVFATRGLYTLLNVAISGSTDLREGVLTNAGTLTAAQIRECNTVADLLALSGIVEAAATNYARQDLASVTLTEGDAADNVTLTATAPTINNVGAGETWRQAFFYIEGANDAARTLVGVDTPASTQVTNGSPITIPALSVTISDTSP